MQKQLWEPTSSAEVLVPGRFTAGAVLSKAGCMKKLLCQAGMYTGTEKRSFSNLLEMPPLTMVVTTCLYPLLLQTDKPRECIFLSKNGQKSGTGTAL